ncbi:MAG: DUF2914 domain-containing protein [Burkholderiales bacterium]
MKKTLMLFAVLALWIPTLTLSAGQVAEAKLGKGVADRQITEESTAFTLGEKAYLWMRVMDGAGETLTISWKTGDQTFDSTLAVGGSPWRTWANKTLHLAGDWTVTVSDSAGTVLHEAKLTVQ